MGFASVRVAAVAAFVSCLVLAAGRARASEREDMTDLFLFGHFAADDDTTASESFFGSDVDVTFDDTIGGGFGIGRNVNDYININGTLLFGSSEIEVGVGSLAASEDVFIVAPDINLDWNILDADVTPFVTAGAGLMFLIGDENNETEFSYGAGAGVRWDISHDAFLKVWYRARWFELEEADDAFMLHSFNVGIGIMR